VDTRLDRSGFTAKHLPGALYAPMNKAFNTVIGSLVVDETTPLALVVEADHLEEAVRDLVRIGYDNVVGFATPDTLETYFENGGAAASIEEITFDDVARMKSDAGATVVDVRFASEFAEGHVPGAVNASYTRLPDYVEDRVPEGRTLLVHCATGARSAAASAFLARLGYDVKYVSDDFTDYATAHEVETGRPALATA
jgi:hydroxyacylglutathione hydrolase